MRFGCIERKGERFRLHIQVVAADSGEPEEFRAFRDRLRADPELLEAYVERKRGIIEEGTTDSVDYATLKVSFIEKALGESRR